MKETYFLTLRSIAEENKGRIVAYTHFPYIEPFSEALEALQKQVGGHIESFYIEALEKHHIDMWIDEEGKLKDGLKPTFVIMDRDDNLIDFIVGNCVFTRFDDEGNTYGLDREDIDIVFKWLGSLPVVVFNREKPRLYGFKLTM